MGVADIVTSPELADEMLFVQAAGNDGGTPMTSLFARLPGVMAVGGYDCRGGRWIIPHDDLHGHDQWWGSDYGQELSIVGPTGDNYVYEGGGYTRMVMASTWPVTGGEYACDPGTTDDIDCMGGTSGATPVVASVAALIFSYSAEHGLGLSPAQVRKIIERTAEDIQCDEDQPGCDCDDPAEACAELLLGWDEYTGYGRVDVGRAFTLPVAALEPLIPYGTPNDPSIRPYVIPGEETYLKWEYIDLLGIAADHFEMHYWDSTGQTWQVIDDQIAPGDTQMVWQVPLALEVGDYGYVRLTVEDSQDRVNRDYRRFDVREEAHPGSAPIGATVSGFWVAPNPAWRGAQVRYELEQASEIRIYVVDATGRRVKTLTNERKASGAYSLDWDGRDETGHSVASGVYFIRLDSESRSKTERLLFIR
jgi:hypothetical protein